MIVNQQMQKGAKVRAGMEARFRMEADTEKRAVPAAPELEKLVRSSRRLQKFYQSLSPSTRVDISRFVDRHVTEVEQRPRYRRGS